MSNQENFLKKIRQKLVQNESINDEIASVLNISYDAAHRRVSGKSKFSIDETVLLANHFNISIDALFLKKDKIIVEKTIEITSLNDMKVYFNNSATHIELLTKNLNATLYYSAKDIPLFYFMETSILSKFKAFVWLNLLNEQTSTVAFENFVIDESFLEPMQKLKTAYEKANVKEIWNDTTINSSLQQIMYYYEAGLLNNKLANALLNDLKRMIGSIQLKCNNQNSQFSIYYNEIILLNNNLLFETDKKLTLFVPYTLLGYFITEHIESCKNVNQFLQQQIKNSKALNHTGLKDQNLFFNKAIRKIEYYMEQVNNQVDILF